jgi:hypothetical protein
VVSSGNRTVSFKAGKQTLTGKVVVFAPCPAVLNGIIAARLMSRESSPGSEYWLRVQADGVHVALSVTECKKILKSILLRSIHADGPVDADHELCVRACGLRCPVQLVDAKARNGKAKQKRSTKIKTAVNVATSVVAASVVAASVATDMKRSALEVTEDEKPPKKARAAIGDLGDTDAPVITVTGSACAMLPVLELLARRSDV